MQRFGKPQKPYYRLVAIDKRSKRNGEPIEILGHYSSLTNEQKPFINIERVKYWLGQGAQPSKRIIHLLKEESKSSAQPVKK